MYTDCVTMSAHSRCEKKRTAKIHEIAEIQFCKKCEVHLVSLESFGTLISVDLGMLISYLSHCCWFLIHHIAAACPDHYSCNMHQYQLLNIHICTFFYRGFKTWQRATYWLDSSVDPHILLLDRFSVCLQLPPKELLTSKARYDMIWSRRI